MKEFLDYVNSNKIDLNEMAFKKAELIEKIDKQNVPLMEHTLCLLSLNEISNWYNTISNIINYLNGLYETKFHKQFMEKKMLMNILLYKPFKDTDDEWIEVKIKRISKSKSMKIHRIPSFNEIVDFYDLLLSDIGSEFDRNKIKNILKTIKTKYDW